MNLRDTFIRECLQFTHDHDLGDNLWTDIYKHYSERSRHYHNLDHLTNMLGQLESCRALIGHWDCIVFALVYHDFVYSVTSKDNEEKSAVESRKNLKALNVPPEKIDLVDNLILATKTHVPDTNNDVNLFTDADLSILGTTGELYKKYSQQVRKEYSIYPDILYNPGRKKVLKHFLEMPVIFKTDFFRDKFEAPARRNLENELREL
ncbi:MAG TPA: hypothetical protein VFE50_19485 [Cyclobacteriaceae bacterium]|nr:hypothetical protein [Cyclobacteriaceae bacterium]